MNHTKFKSVSLLFSVDNAPSPFRIISDIERYFSCEGCVLSLKAFCGDLFICTLCDELVVKRARSGNTFFIDNKSCRYKEVETNVSCIRIELPQWGLNHDDINRIIRQYGSIFVSEIQATDCKRYFAIVELRRDMPSRLKIRNTFCDIVELA